jgi:hypothetical protein
MKNETASAAPAISMKNETLPTLVVINDFIMNFNSISYFQHGYDQNSTQHFIKFKMICGDYVNFDFKNEAEYRSILGNLLQNYPQSKTYLPEISPQNEPESADNTPKNDKKGQKKLKILPKTEE